MSGSKIAKPCPYPTFARAETDGLDRFSGFEHFKRPPSQFQMEPVAIGLL